MKAIVTSLFAVMLSTGSFAATVQVGTCQPALAGYPTISLAVSNVPAGSTIEVCPGSYPEQVVITKPLTLRGVSSQGDNAAVIAAPSGAMQPTPTKSVFTSVAQILVENPGGPVNISNLIVDGTGASNQNVALFVGIYYSDAAGVINNVAVLNENHQFSSGAGVVGENGVATQTAQSLTIENSVLSNINERGVWVLNGGNGFSVTIRSNTIDGAAGNVGLFLEDAGTAPITGSVSSNIISGFKNLGIALHGGGSTIKSNHIDALGGTGMQLVGAATNVVEANTIANSSTAIFGCGFGPTGPPASGDTVTGNRILSANVGVQMPSGNTATPNTINLTAAATQPCP